METELRLFGLRADSAGTLGAFLLEGNKLSFRGMAGTLKACPKGMEQETRLLQTLGKVQAYRIDGNHLELLDEAGEVLARFEAVEVR